MDCERHSDETLNDETSQDVGIVMASWILVKSVFGV